jgi:hypothetical protein
MQVDHAGDDERRRWRAAARAPHEALDPEPPRPAEVKKSDKFSGYATRVPPFQ